MPCLRDSSRGAGRHARRLAARAGRTLGLVVRLVAAVLLVRPGLISRIRRPPLWTLWAALGALWLWNVGFNPTFLTEALRVVDSDEITLELTAPNRPGLLKGGQNFLYVIMPVNLQ